MVRALAAKCMSRLHLPPPPTIPYGETVVKQGIHPRYQRAVVQCACGNTFETRSTSASIHVEICARCHPFFTGKQKLVDTAGRVERFRQRYGREASAAGE